MKLIFKFFVSICIFFFFVNASILIFEFFPFFKIYDSKETFYRGKVVVVTGAASGIGAALSRKLAALGAKVILADINIKKTEAIESELVNLNYTAYSEKVDLAQPDEIKKFAIRILDRYGRIDILFNNAGYGYYSNTKDLELNEAKKQFDVNFWGHVALTKQFLPYFIKQNSGAIINTSSMFSFLQSKPNEALGIYAASKAALTMWTASLKNELSKYKIKVKLNLPGHVKTNFHKSVVGPATKKNWPEKSLNSLMAIRFSDEAEEVADDILSQLLNEYFLILPGKGKYLYLANILFTP